MGKRNDSTAAEAAWGAYNDAVRASGVTMADRNRIDDAVGDLVWEERNAVLSQLYIVAARPTTRTGPRVRLNTECVR